MKGFFSVVISSIFLLACLTGCSSENPKHQAAATGGLIGTAAGAGTGALIGAAISNGDIAASALLGGGVGLPLGILAGVAYANHVENRELNANQEIIDRNKDMIERQREELDAIRQRQYDAMMDFEVDESRHEYMYVGPRIGAYNR